ncbi:probable tRNA N6-adenosine threonylcarbamoyltransferase, mitochondrial [Ischnura elegans]|uniref:probable tRNA N6-adenosine threonylcarbamoyltransferase, mitochondrial n=1 Tax=Ischnura elegans TaxID=197161 RepID=UPI001ED88646|nr:probable tRNA N6-adenosine threonylcarbamoyltransferase, mitochondrial [Ischnura elegans]
MNSKVFSLKRFLSRRNFHCNFARSIAVLGIETSCDDTGCAIVDSKGTILGECLNSQQQVHINHGGIIPPIAKELHEQHIERVVRETLSSSKIVIDDLNAIAATVKPGLPMSLRVGMTHGKLLAKEYNKPFIPIHHMEAHALTIRMIEKVEFPFLVLLVSGGHCLLNLVQDVDKFLLLGQSIDDAPGEAFDKFARRMKLHMLKEYSTMSGGRAVETAASKGDPNAFVFPMALAHYKDCNFSVAGLKNTARKHIIRLEKEHEVEPDQMVPQMEDLCASFQLAITKHLCHRLQRAMEYITLKKYMPPDKEKTLVVSGGVACNKFIRGCLGQVCDEMGYRLLAPPPHLCTDNGAMIAWNGMERWNTGKGIIDPSSPEFDEVDVQGRCILGEDMTEDVVLAGIKCKWIKLKY